MPSFSVRYTCRCEPHESAFLSRSILPSSSGSGTLSLRAQELVGAAWTMPTRIASRLRVSVIERPIDLIAIRWLPAPDQLHDAGESFKAGRKRCNRWRIAGAPSGEGARLGLPVRRWRFVVFSLRQPPGETRVGADPHPRTNDRVGGAEQGETEVAATAIAPPWNLGNWTATAACPRLGESKEGKS